MSAPAVLSVDPKAEWLTKAAIAITDLAARYHSTGQTFTADDVYLLAGEPDNQHWPGAAFLAAKGRGEIVKTHAYTQSTRRGRRGSTIAVWRAAT